MNQRQNVAAVMTVREQGAERRIFQLVTVAGSASANLADLHTRIRSEVSPHANWTWSAKAAVMNPAAELRAAGSSSGRCAINSPPGPAPAAKAGS